MKRQAENPSELFVLKPILLIEAVYLVLQVT